MSAGFCLSTRKLLDKDDHFVHNLYGTDFRQNPDLSCGILGPHHVHVAHVITQWFGEDLLGWWASWRSTESIWEDYSLFQGPFCPECNADEEPCLSVKGHEGQHSFD